MKKRFSSVEEAVEAVAQGRIVIVVDSEDREDEGDFLAAAQFVTPATVHFLATHGRGQICMPVAPAMAKRLNLRPMSAENSNPTGTAFAIPIDHRSCRTGISPVERAFTVRAALDPHSRPDDFVRPGHVFPLIARAGGVLERPGHTEAAVELARLARLAPAGLLCEICSRDGLHMAGRTELMEIARDLRLPILAIDDVIAYVQREQAVPSRVLRTRDVDSRLSSSIAEEQLGGAPAVSRNGHASVPTE